MTSRRILVGTLESGEQEFEECKELISAQKFVKVHHIVISGLREREAHAKLIQTWLVNKPNFDYFIKVDADTVLNSDTTLATLADFMKSRDATGIQVKLLDYFSKELISGLNMFTPEVKFRTRPSRLYPDQLDFGHRLQLKGHHVAQFEPIGFHGKNPNSRQSFYYGYHRFLKGQSRLLRSCFTNYLEIGDEARKWALIGAYAARHDRMPKFLFSSKRVLKAFKRFQETEISIDALSQFAENL